MPFPALSSLPAPVTWGTLAQVKAPQLRADVSNAVQLFTGPPFFAGAYLGVSTAIPGGGTITPVPIDTEYADPWSGHQIGTSGNPNNPRYYAPLAGWYLAQSAVSMYPVVTGTTAGASSAGIQAVTNGAGSNSFMGQRLPNQVSGSLTPVTMPVACKLVKMVQAGGAYGTGDWIAPAVSQNSGSLLDLNSLTAGQAPYFSARWACATTGTEPLPVPVNDNFAVPPQLVTHAFMNKNIRDAISFLTFPPVMEWQYDNGTNTLASQGTIPVTGTTIGLDTMNVDNYSAFSNGSNTWTAPVDGIYFCYGQVALSVTANSLSTMAGFTISSANYNGGTAFTYWGGAQASYAGSAFPNCAFTRRRLRLNAGDTVKLAGWQRDSGGAANTVLGTTTNWTTRIGIVWQGA